MQTALDEGKRLLQLASETARATYESESSRTGLNQIYATIEDFYRCPPARRRLVVIGCTGAGKSTLLNVLGGCKYVQDPGDYHWAWDAPPLFEARAGCSAVTKQTTYANLHWLGDEARPLVAVDTPGHDDTDGRDISSKTGRDALRQQAADLHHKLKAMGKVHAILVLHNQVTSNRLNPATYAILQMIDEKFGPEVWRNVIVAYSQCNQHMQASWMPNLQDKMDELRREIRAEVPGCEVDVPVITVGGGSMRGAEEAPERGLAELWAFLEAADPIDTTTLKPFEGAQWCKYEALVKERDVGVARADAALVYVSVVLKLACVIAFLLWRSLLLPAWLSVLFLNLTESTVDEAVLLLGLVWLIGPMRTWYSVTFFYEQWLAPHVQALRARAVHAKVE